MGVRSAALILLHLALLALAEDAATPTLPSQQAAAAPLDPVVCRDPALGISFSGLRSRGALLVGGKGAGIGNFLGFYPAAYYFALLTGRLLFVLDDSLMGEMCAVVTCGFPKYSDMTKAFPRYFDSNKLAYKKAWDFRLHLDRSAPLEVFPVIVATGYKPTPGWYAGVAHAGECIRNITGCRPDDFVCHDRYAFRKLVLGPWLNSQRLVDEESKIHGVPFNIKHAMLTLPHAFAPRLQAAVHLRCQFQHFERLVGPDDGAAWTAAVRELHDWMNSTAPSAGPGLFKAVKDRMVQDLGNSSAAAAKLTSIGEDESQIYVYAASDNEEVKEAFARYLEASTEAKFVVMRVINTYHVVHAKNLEYVRSAGNFTGIIDLVLDWYALSLASNVYAWRRDTDLLSTFAQSAERMSRQSDGDDGSKGLFLVFKNHRAHWKEFY